MTESDQRKSMAATIEASRAVNELGAPPNRDVAPAVTGPLPAPLVGDCPVPGLEVVLEPSGTEGEEEGEDEPPPPPPPPALVFVGDDPLPAPEELADGAGPPVPALLPGVAGGVVGVAAGVVGVVVEGEMTTGLVFVLTGSCELVVTTGGLLVTCVWGADVGCTCDSAGAASQYWMNCANLGSR